MQARETPCVICGYRQKRFSYYWYSLRTVDWLSEWSIGWNPASHSSVGAHNGLRVDKVRSISDSLSSGKISSRQHSPKIRPRRDRGRRRRIGRRNGSGTTASFLVTQKWKWVIDNRLSVCLSTSSCSLMKSSDHNEESASSASDGGGGPSMCWKVEPLQMFRMIAWLSGRSEQKQPRMIF